MTLIIANPKSGRGRGRRTAESVARFLRAGGCTSDVRWTGAAGDGERIAREACLGPTTPKRILACGGDGTVQEVVNGLMSVAASTGQRPVLALAPAGRCNDFARAVGIPTDPLQIARIIVGGQTQWMDLGRVNQRYFCTVATAGIDASVSEYVDRMRLPLKGTLAYLYATLRVLMAYRAPQVRLTGDFGVYEKEVFLASSANTSSYGGAIPIVPGAQATDGLLDLCVIDRVSRLRALMLIPIILAGRHKSCRAIRFLRTRQMRIESRESLTLWADGERVATTPATVEAVSRAIQILVPAQKARQIGHRRGTSWRRDPSSLQPFTLWVGRKPVNPLKIHAPGRFFQVSC